MKVKKIWLSKAKQFHAHLYRNTWLEMIKFIKQRSLTLDDLQLLSAVEQHTTFEDDDVAELYAQCSIESDDDLKWMKMKRQLNNLLQYFLS